MFDDNIVGLSHELQTTVNSRTETSTEQSILYKINGHCWQLQLFELLFVPHAYRNGKFLNGAYEKFTKTTLCIQFSLIALYIIWISIRYRWALQLNFRLPVECGVLLCEQGIIRRLKQIMLSNFQNSEWADFKKKKKTHTFGEFLVCYDDVRNNLYLCLIDIQR